MEELAKELTGKAGKLVAVECDVCNPDSIDKAFGWVKENMGDVHILVNNAGTFRAGPLLETEYADWKLALDTNVLGLSKCTQVAFNHMQEAKVDGHIVLINSISGHTPVVGDPPMVNMYSPSKFAVTCLTEVIRRELMYYRTKIKVSSVSPGMVDTEIFASAGLGDLKESIFDKIPHLQPVDVQNAVMYILSTPPNVQVAGLARRVERVDELTKGLGSYPGKLHPVKCDITNVEDVRRSFEWVEKNLGPVHILVNNAGVYRHGTLIEGDPADWKTVIDTNIMGLCVCTKEAYNQMKEHNIVGHIVHINSVSGHWPLAGNPPFLNIYSPTKHAVTCLTEIMRRELIHNKSMVKITSISPGLVRTEILKAAGSKPTGISYDTSQVLECEDIAKAVVFIIGTPLHVHVQEMIIRPTGEQAYS